MNFLAYHLQIDKQNVTVLEPLQTPSQLWFGEPVIDSRSLLANGEGFAFMRDLFLIAAQTKEPHVMFYVPGPRFNERTPARTADEIKGSYRVGEFDLELVLFDSRHLRIRPKEIRKAIDSLGSVEKAGMSIQPEPAQFDQEKPYKTLHTETYAKTMIVDADCEALLHLAHLSERFVSIEDDAAHNLRIHAHAGSAGSSECGGLNFFYYFQP